MKLLFRKTFFLSLFCHIFCFTLIGFNSPLINSGGYEVRFLGSFLSEIDFLNPKNSSRYTKDGRVMSLDNLFIQRASAQLKKQYLISKIDKPISADKFLTKNIFLANNKKNDIINVEGYKSSLAFDAISFNDLVPLGNDVPSNLLKVKVFITPDGRVEFVERLEGSGDLETDLLVKQHCLDYIFYPNFDRKFQVKKINLSSS